MNSGTSVWQTSCVSPQRGTRARTFFSFLNVSLTFSSLIVGVHAAAEALCYLCVAPVIAAGRSCMLEAALRQESL